MIKVESELKVYEIEGLDVTIDGRTLKVLSHWNSHDRVVLEIEGKKHTVVARDLLAAISNATNTARF